MIKKKLLRAIVFIVFALMINVGIYQTSEAKQIAQTMNEDTAEDADPSKLYTDVASAVENATEITKDQNSVTLDYFDRFLLDGAEDEEIAEKARIYKLPKGDYVLRMTIAEADLNNYDPAIYYFSNQKVNTPKNNGAIQSTLKNGKKVYTLIASEKEFNYSKNEWLDVSNYLWISELPENCTFELEWVSPYELADMENQAVELPVTGEKQTITNASYIRYPEWATRYIPSEDEVLTSEEYISHYSIRFGVLYKIGVPAHSRISVIVTDSNGNSTYLIQSKYYTELTNDHNAEGGITNGEFVNDTDSEQTYYAFVYTSDANFDYSGYTIQALEIPYLSKDTELTATITNDTTLNDVTTSDYLIKTTNNSKGYGNLYKVTVPGNMVLTMGCGLDNVSIYTNVYTPDLFPDERCNYITLWDEMNKTTSIPNYDNEEKEYYVWIYFDTYQKYNIQFQYAKTLISQYGNAILIDNEDTITVEDAANQSNYLDDFYCANVAKYAVLYHFPEGQATITVKAGNICQIDILDEHANTGYILKRKVLDNGSVQFKTSDYNCSGKECWLLISADTPAALNNCTITYEKQKPIEQNQTNAMTIDESYKCSTRDKTLKWQDTTNEYYVYSIPTVDYFENHSDLVFQLTSSKEQPDYKNILFTNEYGTELSYKFMSDSSYVTVQKITDDFNDILVWIPVSYTYSGIETAWKNIVYTTKLDAISLKAGNPPTLGDMGYESKHLTDGTVFKQKKTDDYAYNTGFFNGTVLFDAVIPKGLSATFRLRNYGFYKNVYVYDDLSSRKTICEDEHEGVSTVLLDIPINESSDKTYYILTGPRLFGESDTEIEIILKDAWRRANRFDKYAVPVDPNSKIIDLGRLEATGLLIDNIGTVSNGTFDKQKKRIQVDDVTQAVQYEYKIADHYVTLRFIPYIADGETSYVSEGKTKDDNGNTVENLVQISSDGNMDGIVTETTMNPATMSGKSTLVLTESKNLSEDSTNAASLNLEQSQISSTDIQTAIDLAKSKNATYVSNGQTASIGEITASFNTEANEKIDSTVFQNIQSANGQTGFDFSLSKINDEGNEEYSWQFNGSKIDHPEQSVNPDMDMQIDNYNADINQLVSDKEQVAVLNFKNSGILPGEASVKIDVSEKYKNGQTVVCSYFNEAENCLEEEQKVTVENGYITIKISHCSDYVLSEMTHDASEHEEVIDPAIPATCSSEGLTEGSHCKLCGATIKPQEKTKKLPHTYSDWIVDKTATVDAEGHRYKECTVCKTVLQEETIAKIPAPEPTPTPEPSTEPKPEPTPTPTPAPVVTPDVTVSYRTHVQSIGWQGVVTNGTMSGTSGKAKRLEGIEISVAGNSNLGIQYTTHCQSYGWLPWSANGEMNGTEGEAKRLEAIKIQLTGADKDKYNVYYRVHAQSYGWLTWAANGAPAGTAGLAKRLEAIQIVIVKKGESFDHAIGNIQSARGEAYIASSTANANPVVIGENNVNVEYRTHVQSLGWQGWKYNGVMSGTSGKAKRLEGINIKLTNKPYSGSIVYTTHVQSIGWQGNENNVNTWFRDGQMAGTSGRAKRLEAIRIALTGEMAEHYDVYYRVHAQSFGWLDWTKNGEAAGTAGLSKRLEGIQIVLVPKGGAAPARNYGGVVTINNNSYIKR